MTYKEIMEIELRVVTVAIWIGRAISVACFLAVAWYLYEGWL